MKVLAIRGVLDSSTGQRFEKSLQDLLREYTEPIGLDCSGLKYMTSAGVASFLRVGQRARERGGRLAVIRPSEEVGMMLDFLGISKQIPVYASEEEMRQAMPQTQSSIQFTERSQLSSSRAMPEPSRVSGATGGSEDTTRNTEGSRAFASSASAAMQSTEPSGDLNQEASIHRSQDAYHMGESVGRLSETLDGLTRHLKSLGQTMEDLQRTEHSLKEEFERERRERRKRSVRKSDVSVRNSRTSVSGTVHSGIESPEIDNGTAAVSSQSVGGKVSPPGRLSSMVPDRTDANRSSALEPGKQRAPDETLAPPIRTQRADGGRSAAKLDRILTCEQCGTKLRIYHAGRHLCPACKIEFEVETDGSTSYYEKLASS